jgi:hypothetical protein
MIQVNLTAVVLASVAAMGVGFIWYSDTLFGKKWAKYNNLSGPKMEKEAMIKNFSITFVGALISAYILSMFMHYAGAINVVDGVKTAFWAWLGFVLPTGLANSLFLKRSLEAYCLEAGHHLVALAVMGAIIAYMY